MKKPKDPFKFGIQMEWHKKYEISEILRPNVVRIVRTSDNPRATLCTLLGISGEKPKGQSDGMWVEQDKTNLYLVSKPHTGWY